MTDGHVLAIDFGGTKVALTTATAQTVGLREVLRLPTRSSAGALQVVRRSFEAARKLLAAPDAVGVSTFDAHEMINQHHELFAVYWRWSDDWLAHALDTGVMWTPLGWTCCTGFTEFNARSIRNFPIQGSGADILRVACIWATRHGLRLLAPVHDAVLIEAPIERIEADVALMQEIMRRASRVVLGGHELRTDAKIIRHPERYTDRRGDAVWANVLALLAEYRQGAMPCETARHAN